MGRDTPPLLQLPPPSPPAHRLFSRLLRTAPSTRPPCVSSPVRLRAVRPEGAERLRLPGGSAWHHRARRGARASTAVLTVPDAPLRVCPPLSHCLILSPHPSCSEREGRVLPARRAAEWLRRQAWPTTDVADAAQEDALRAALATSKVEAEALCGQDAEDDGEWRGTGRQQRRRRRSRFTSDSTLVSVRSKTLVCGNAATCRERKITTLFTSHPPPIPSLPLAGLKAPSGGRSAAEMGQQKPIASPPTPTAPPPPPRAGAPLLKRERHRCPHPPCLVKRSAGPPRAALSLSAPSALPLLCCGPTRGMRPVLRCIAQCGPQ